jgi:L-alanine-DL-glutamate epimerase-like enolase superfamily enzyme
MRRVANSRREFLRVGTALSALNLATGSLPRAVAGSQDAAGAVDRAWTLPVLEGRLFKRPVRIAAIELLKNGGHYLVRARSADGATGIAAGHASVLRSAYPILLNRVLPFFVGKDARDLESLLHEAYVGDSNYKWQGLPFWVSVACTEIAILDLLGQVAGQPLGEMLGGVVRREIAVYRASGQRGNTPEAEVAYLEKIVAETGANAIKFRLGARMRYDEASTRRDLALIPLSRKAFGPGMTIYADANGSYDVAMAIRIGRVMEQHQCAFFEEPVPFDYYDETKAIADTLEIPVAGGEQESSLRRFRWMIEKRAVEIVQPDLLYFGGLTRSIRVARMAAAAGMTCTPHMSGGGFGYLYVAHFASCVPNAGPYQEYKGAQDTLPVRSETSSLRSEKGVLRVPAGPGLGVTIDPAFMRKADVVTV